ncbi:MAG: hypothetical protein R2911_08740 [Caldilineaceae bacterium]
MKKQYDFTKGERGKFYNPSATFRFPIYLEPDVDEFLNKLADQKGIELQALVNEWLRTNIRLVETVQ